MKYIFTINVVDLARIFISIHCLFVFLTKLFFVFLNLPFFDISAFSMLSFFFSPLFHILFQSLRPEYL